MSGYRGFRQHLHVTNSGDIGCIASCGAPIATQLLGAGFSFLEITRDDEDLAAISTEYVGDSLADAFARSGDDGGPAGDRSQHGSSPGRLLGGTSCHLQTKNFELVTCEMGRAHV